MVTSRRAKGAITLLVSAVAVLGANPAWATAGAPKQGHTAGDMARARSVLLRGSDFHDLWKPDQPKPTSDPLTCSARLTPDESDLVETGKAVGPFFTRGSKEALAQSVHVYANKAQANAAWARRTLRKAVLCMQRRMEDTSSMMSWISVTSWHALDLRQPLPHIAGYRVIGDAVAGNQKAKVYLDLLLLGRDRTLTMVVLTSYTSPLPSAFEEKLVRTISERLAAE